MIFVVTPDQTHEQIVLLSKLLKQLGRDMVFVRSFEELMGHPRYSVVTSGAILLPVQRTTPAAEEAVARFAEAEGGRFYIVYIAETMTAEAYKRLVRSGSGEWIKWPALAAELGEVLQEADRHGKAAPVSGAAVISFVPSKGGVGNTTLALETAIMLAQDEKKAKPRIALLELNFQKGTLADYLDLEPRLDIEEIMNRPDRLDEQLIDFFTSRHASGIDVFASVPRQIDYSQLSSTTIFTLLDQLSHRYDFVLLDLPSVWLPWIDNVVIGSDAIVVTGGSNVPSVKQLAHQAKLLDELGIPPAKVSFAVNACLASKLGRIVRKPEIDRTLAGRRIFYIRRDTRLAVEAANTGRPMAQISSWRRVCRDIREVSDWIGQGAALPRRSSSKPMIAADRKG